MRFVAALVVTGLVAQAAELDARVLRLIGEDARLVAGIDAERAVGYAFGLMSTDPEMERCQTIVAIAISNGRGLHVCIAKEPLPPTQNQYKGVPVLAEKWAWTAHLGDVSVQGPAEAVRAAIDRWLAPQATLTPLAERVRKLSATYEAWMAMSKPLELMARDPELLAKWGPQVVPVIEEVRAGMRFGAFHEVTVEIDSDSPSNAIALAALARWLPNFLQLVGGSDEFVGMLGTAERLRADAYGNTVLGSLALEDGKLRELFAPKERAK